MENKPITLWVWAKWRKTKSGYTFNTRQEAQEFWERHYKADKKLRHKITETQEISHAE